MSWSRYTQQSSTPEAPNDDNGIKTVKVFGVDDSSSPGTTVLGSIDSDGNVGNYKGPIGDQGDPGDQGEQGEPGPDEPLFNLNSSTSISVPGKYFIDADSGNITITIPDPDSATNGHTYRIYKISSDSNKVTIVTTTGKDIGGETSQEIFNMDAGFSMTDDSSHYHIVQDSRHRPFSVLDPLEISNTTGVVGTSQITSREDHVHPHGNRGGGTLHAVSGGNAGFMSSSDKGKLDGIGAGAEVNAPLASNADAVAGTDTTKTMTPLRVHEAIDSRGNFSTHGGVSAVGGNTTKGASYGHNNATGGFTALRSGEIYGVTVRASTLRNSGTCTISSLVNGVVQNGPGEETIIDDLNTQSNFQEISPTIGYDGGDILDIQTTTVGFSPTGADMVVTLRYRDH